MPMIKRYTVRELDESGLLKTPMHTSWRSGSPNTPVFKPFYRRSGEAEIAITEYFERMGYTDSYVPPTYTIVEVWGATVPDDDDDC